MLVEALRAISLHRGPGYRCLSDKPPLVLSVSSFCAAFARSVEDVEHVKDRTENFAVKRGTGQKWKLTPLFVPR